ncbi:MAG: adenylate/guanylate cyclase domain-containing protein [Gammaproteobacteria bacterium]|nr:adenylate/guanylate cyclase domain-containing protein [Gammaproteobacteria bacterium]
MLTDKSTVDVIKKSRKRITILFSDIESSTRHWERRGDIDARMMLDRHNRLLFPVIRKFNGKIIKTLGDAIMAAFKEPENAVKAAIAMQQIMSKERQKDKYFSLRLRIGLHTGTGIVEDADIFGDVVNVAAKVEAEAEANQILLTKSTGARFPTDRYALTEIGSFKTKGKRKPVELLNCDWTNHPSLIDNLKQGSLLPLMKQQKFEILTYISVSLVALFFIYHYYIRYLLKDNNLLFSHHLYNSFVPAEYISITAIIGLPFIGLFIYLLKIDFISRSILRIINGTFGFGVVIFLFGLFNSSLDLPFNKRWYEPVYQSKNLFVEIIAENTPLKAQPNTKSRTIRLLHKGDIFLYQDSQTAERRRWDKVAFKQNTPAWIARKTPPAFGVTEQQLTKTYKFGIHFYDIYGAILGILGFIWGFLNFKIRPN